MSDMNGYETVLETFVDFQHALQVAFYTYMHATVQLHIYLYTVISSNQGLHRLQARAASIFAYMYAKHGMYTYLLLVYIHMCGY
jgi:hypothetical protein